MLVRSECAPTVSEGVSLDFEQALTGDVAVTTTDDGGNEWAVVVDINDNSKLYNCT